MAPDDARTPEPTNAAVPAATGPSTAEPATPEQPTPDPAFLEALGGEAFAALFDPEHFRAGLVAKGLDAGGMDEAALRALLAERGAELRVSPTPFFDETHYLDRHPDIRDAGLWGFQHFLIAGIDEGRQPHPLIDVEFIAVDRGVALGEALRTWLANQSAPNDTIWHGYRRWRDAPRLPQQRAIFRGLAQHCGDWGLAHRALTYLPLLVEPQLSGEASPWTLVARALGPNAYDVLPSPFARLPVARCPGDEGGAVPLLDRLQPDPGRRWSFTPWLDMGCYDARNPDLSTWDHELLLHFLRHGQFEGRVGHPMFDPQWYRTHYGLGDGQSIHTHYVVSAWRGYAMRSNSACMAPIDYAILAGVDTDRAIDEIVASYANILAISSPSSAGERLGSDEAAVARQIDEAAALDPSIRADRPDRAVMPKPFDVAHAAPLTRMSRMLAGCDVIILRDHITIGGADRVAGAMARTLGANGFRVGVVATTRMADHDVGTDRYGDAAIVVLEDLVGQNEASLAVDLVYEAATLPDTRAVIAVSSAAGLEVFRRFGRQVAAWTTMFVAYFCDDEDQYGNPDGYPARSFLPLIGHVAGVFTDTLHLRDTLRGRVAPSAMLAARVRTLPTPYVTDASGEEPANPVRSSPHRRIAWAGRFDRQKRADLLPAIAARMPDAEFDVWGKAVLDVSPFDGVDDHGLSLRGTFRSFSQVLARAPDAFLYTAAWDGAPTILLDAVAAGLPIVASDVGGVRECLPPDYPYLVPAGEGPDAYAAMLSRLLEDTERLGRDVVTKGFETVIASRDEKSFARILLSSLARAGIEPTGRSVGADVGRGR